MTPAITTCEYTDVALSLQQTIREREAANGGAPMTVTIGEACGKPSVGSIEDDGVRRQFCGDHVRFERVLRD
jgi:hypothetical protein